MFYEARDAITAIRNPLSYGEEGSTRQRSEGETPEEKKNRDNAFVVFERYNKRQEMFNKLFSLRYRFMALFGKDKAVPFEEIRKDLNKIFIAAQTLVRLREIRTDHYNEQQQENHLKQIQKHAAVFWWAESEKDELSKHVDKAVSDIEQFCGNIIMGKSTEQID